MRATAAELAAGRTRCAALVTAVSPGEPLETHLRGCGLGRASSRRGPYSDQCPRATPSTTPRTGSGRCSRATCRTRSRRRTRASAATAGPSASQGQAVTRRRRPRQAPVPALRGRAGDPLAPAHDRQVARPRRRLADARATRGWSSAAASTLVAQINGPVLELMTDSRARFDRRLAMLGPGHPRARARRGRRSCAGCARTTRRARSATRCSTSGSSPGSATCGRPRAASRREIDPWRRTGDVSDDEVLAIVHATRPRMQESALRRHAGALQGRLRHRRPPVPALRRGLEHPLTRAGRRQPDDILVSTMSALRRIGHKGADLIVPGNTPASFDAALAHGVDMIEFDVLPEHQHAPATGRLLLAHDYEHVDGAPTLEEGLAHLASSAVRRRRARRRPQAPRLRGARRSRRCASTGWSSARWSRRTGCARWSRSARSSRSCGSAGRSRACKQRPDADRG